MTTNPTDTPAAPTRQDVEAWGKAFDEALKMRNCHYTGSILKAERWLLRLLEQPGARLLAAVDSLIAFVRETGSLAGWCDLDKKVLNELDAARKACPDAKAEGRELLQLLLAWIDQVEDQCDLCPVHIDGDDLRAKIRELLASAPATTAKAEESYRDDKAPCALCGKPTPVLMFVDQLDGTTRKVFVNDYIEELRQRAEKAEAEIARLRAERDTALETVNKLEAEINTRTIPLKDHEQEVAMLRAEREGERRERFIPICVREKSGIELAQYVLDLINREIISEVSSGYMARKLADKLNAEGE